jgi:hypothetical protein
VPFNAFGPWQPDQYLLNAGGVSAEALGVLCTSNAYIPLPQAVPSSIATGTPALTSMIRGGFTARDSNNNPVRLSFSSANAYRFTDGSSPWTDVTRTTGGTYNLATDDYWSTCQYGNIVIAANGNDAPQYIDVDVGTSFAALPGTPPNSRYVEVIGEFAQLGAPSINRRSVKWSGRNDASTWAAYTKDSDIQTFPDGGDVMGLAGFETGGLIFQVETVRRQLSRTDAAIFEFHRIDLARGTMAPYAIVNDSGDVYYYSTTGFMRIGTDNSVTNIGAGRVNAWFRANCNVARYKAIIGALDPSAKRVFWLFPTESNAGQVLDHLIVYDIDFDRWTHAPCALTYIFTSWSPPWTIGQLSAAYGALSNVPQPLGAYGGGAPCLAAFDAQNRMCMFNGNPMAASVQTPPFEPIENKRAMVNGFRLYGDAITATGRVGGAERPQDNVVWNGYQPINAQGRIPARRSTRIAQVQVDISSANQSIPSWSKLAGIDFDAGDIISDGLR